jgi:hypothetical protein
MSCEMTTPLGNLRFSIERTDKGATFESTINLSNTDEKSWTPTITATIVNTEPTDTLPLFHRYRSARTQRNH